MAHKILLGQGRKQILLIQSHLLNVKKNAINILGQPRNPRQDDIAVKVSTRPVGTRLKLETASVTKSPIICWTLRCTTSA